MNAVVEFTYDLDSNHPDWSGEESCQMLISANAPLTKDDLKRLRITPRALREVFAEARELSKDIRPNQRVIADRGWRGRGERYRGRSKDDFLVALCGYAE